jgi:hypothetical protein
MYMSEQKEMKKRQNENDTELGNKQMNIGPPLQEFHPGSYPRVRPPKDLENSVQVIAQSILPDAATFVVKNNRHSVPYKRGPDAQKYVQSDFDYGQYIDTGYGGKKTRKAKNKKVRKSRKSRKSRKTKRRKGKKYSKR